VEKRVLIAEKHCYWVLQCCHGNFHPSPRSHPPRSPSVASSAVALGTRAPSARDGMRRRKKWRNHHFFVWHWHESHAHLHRAQPQLLCPHAWHVSALAHAHAPGLHAHASPHLSHAMKKRNLKRVARSFVRSRVVPRARVTPRFGARTVVYQVLSALFICLRVVVVNNFV